MKLFSILRYTAVVTLVASLFIISGCDNDDDKGPTVFSGSLLDYIAVESGGTYTPTAEFKQSATVTADNALDSLVKYITLYPELNTLLDGTTEYTFFAPSNTAFISLTALPGLSNIALVNPDIIKGVLSYHFVAGKKLKADLTAGTKLNTLYTDAATSTVQQIEINSDGTLKTGSTNQAIVITTADKQTTNGVMHITASALIPPSVGATLTPILGTIAGTVLLGKDFTYLASLILKADAGFTEGDGLASKKISTLLAIPASTPGFNGATFFATPNTVFGVIAQANAVTVTQYLAAITKEQARGILLKHYAFGKLVVTAASGATAITGETTAQTAAGVTLKFATGLPVSNNNPYGVIVTTDLATSAKYNPIVKKDIVHNNGILQVIAGIIQ